MKLHIDLMLFSRKSTFATKIYVENVTPAYVIILKLLLEAIILAITLHINTIFALLGV